MANTHIYDWDNTTIVLYHDPAASYVDTKTPFELLYNNKTTGDSISSTILKFRQTTDNFVSFDNSKNIFITNGDSLYKLYNGNYDSTIWKSYVAGSMVAPAFLMPILTLQTTIFLFADNFLMKVDPDSGSLV